MDNETHREGTPKRHHFLRLFGILFLLLCAALLYFTIFPAPIVRFALSRLAAKTGVTVMFEKTYFNLGKRALTLENVTIKRQNHPEGNFDLQADIVHVDIPPQSPHPNGAALLTVSGLHGTYERTGKDLPHGEENNEKQAATTRRRGNTLLRLFDSEVVFIDRTLPQPFQATIAILDVDVTRFSHTDKISMFGKYSVRGGGTVDTQTFFAIATNEALFRQVPMKLISPYVPILNDLFDTGSVEIKTNDLTDEMQKKVLVTVFVEKDCRLKPANKILIPALQSALQKLDQSSLPALQELRMKIGDVQTFAESLHSEIDKAAPIVDALAGLAPKDVRERYERIKSRYDRLRSAPEEFQAKLESFQRDIDKAKAEVMQDAIQNLIETGTPLVFYIVEENGQWHADWIDAVVRLIEQHYRAFLAGEYQQRIQAMLEEANRLLIL